MLKQGLANAAGFAIFNVGAKAIGFVKDQLVDTVQVAMKHQEVMAQTAQAIKSTGDASGLSAQSIENMAESLSHVTTFSKDTAQEGENLLLTFTGIGKDVFPQATQTMLDMSQALGQDVKSSAIQLGKALNDPLTGLTALQRVGVTFSASEKEQIKTMMSHNDVIGAQRVMLKELQTEFGGSAEAAGKTFGGQLQILKNNLEDVKEKIGTALLPILSQLVSGISSNVMPLLDRFGGWFTNTAVPAIQHFGTVLGKAWAILNDEGLGVLIASLQNLATTIGSDLAPVLTPLANAFKNLFSDKSVTSGAKQVEGSFYNIAAGVDAVRGGINTLGNLYKQLVAAMQSPVMKEVFKTLQEIGGFVVAIFKPIWDQLVTTWKTQLIPAFQELAPIMEPLKMLFGAIAMIIGTVLVVALALLVGAIKGVLQFISAMVQGIIQAIGGIIQFAAGLITVVSGLIAFLVDLFTGNWSKLGTDLEAVWNGILNMAGGFGNVFMGIFKSFFSAVWGLVSGFVTGVIDFFVHLFDMLVGHSIIPDMINGIINWFTQLPGRAMSAIQGLAGSIGSFFSGLATDALNAGSNIVKSIGTGISNAMHFVTDAMTSVTSWISSHLPHSPAKVGPLVDLPKQSAMITEQIATGMLSSMPKLNAALGQLLKPVAVNLNSTAQAAYTSAGAIPASISQATPAQANQGTPVNIYLNGDRIASALLPAIVSQIRFRTGNWAQ